MKWKLFIPKCQVLFEIITFMNKTNPHFQTEFQLGQSYKEGVCGIVGLNLGIVKLDENLNQSTLIVGLKKNLRLFLKNSWT